MKYVRDGLVQAESGVFANVPAVRCDAIQLDAKDVHVMFDALNNGSEVCRESLKEVLGKWMCRFVPPCGK